MPFLRLTLAPEPALSVAAELAERLTTLMAERLGKRAELTSVLVETARGLWAIGGAAQAKAAHLEVTITAGTNSDAEKAAFIAAAAALLDKHLPDLHEATYVTVREAPATHWGYNGRTQRARRLASV